MILFIERLSLGALYTFTLYFIFIMFTSSSPLEKVDTGEMDKIIKMTVFIMVIIIPILISLLIYYVKDTRVAERETITTYLMIVANQEARADKESEILGSIANALKLIERNQESYQSTLMENIIEIKSLIKKG